MTLWAVQVETYDDSVRTRFPSRTREAAAESAGRINDWVNHMSQDHPDDRMADGIVATVVEWPDSDEQHARELAATEAFMAAEEQEDE